jgi:hypothetical protein
MRSSVYPYIVTRTFIFEALLVKATCKMLRTGKFLAWDELILSYLSTDFHKRQIFHFCLLLYVLWVKEVWESDGGILKNPVRTWIVYFNINRFTCLMINMSLKQNIVTV